MNGHNYSVFITHGMFVFSDRELTEDELIAQAVDTLMSREREQLIGGSDFEIEKWKDKEYDNA
jgi:hypothetical protein